MKKCVKVDYNISEAEINIRSPHDISIIINREAKNPTISSLRERIEQLELFNLHLDSEIDNMLAQKIGELDLVGRAALAELLQDYSTQADLSLLRQNMITLLAQERLYNDARYLQKAYITQAQYDAMGEDDKKENTIYVIRN